MNLPTPQEVAFDFARLIACEIADAHPGVSLSPDYVARLRQRTQAFVIEQRMVGEQQLKERLGQSYEQLSDKLGEVLRLSNDQILTMVEVFGLLREFCRPARVNNLPHVPKTEGLDG